MQTYRYFDALARDMAHEDSFEASCQDTTVVQAYVTLEMENDPNVSSTYFATSQLENNTLLHEAPIDEPSDLGFAHNLQLDIARWSAKLTPTRQSLDDLIMVSNDHGHKLPKDSRTILKTQRSVDVEEKCGGKHAYVGIASGLFKYISSNPDTSTDSEIVIKVNIDGVPLLTFSNHQFRPI